MGNIFLAGTIFSHNQLTNKIIRLIDTEITLMVSSSPKWYGLESQFEA